MFRKLRLKKEIKACIARIEKTEKLRTRSQAALLEAILTHQSPDDADVDYFNRYTAIIDEERDKMHALKKELAELNK